MTIYALRLQGDRLGPDCRRQSVPSPLHPQLSHCGVYARDIDAMVAFYTKTIGLVVSDRGLSSRGGELAFMTAAPGTITSSSSFRGGT